MGIVDIAANWLDERNKNKLLDQLPQDGTAVSQPKLCDKLGWSEKLFHGVRDELIREGAVEVGKGPGGALHRTPPPPKKPEPNWLPPEVREIVWERDKHGCAIKGCKTPTERLSFDHIIPRSEGGSSTDPGNIRVLCQHHNSSKGTGVGD